MIFSYSITKNPNTDFKDIFNYIDSETSCKNSCCFDPAMLVVYNITSGGKCWKIALLAC